MTNSNLRNKHTGYLLKLLLAPIFVVSLAACVAAAVGVAAITIDVLHDRRTAGEYLDDSSIELQMNTYLARNKDIRKNANVDPTSWNGILLLTGEVTNAPLKQQILTKANNITGIRQVVDETRIAEKTGFFSRSNDAWITTKTKSKLAVNMGLTANRIKVKTEFGHVYLMGIVTQDEARKATAIARTVRRVERVVKVFEYTN